MRQTTKRWNMKFSHPRLISRVCREELMYRCLTVMTAIIMVTASIVAAPAQQLSQAPASVYNQSAPGPYAVPQPFSQEQLDQMLAPIALYPDELLAQVLMAATYPAEVVQAARWVQLNARLTGDQLAWALEEQPWDPSVKSLVNFPSVLQMMNDRLDWTQQLGDAFLAQEEQVMATVQQLRQRAWAQGYLANTSEQTVFVDPQTQQIVIQPVVPQIIYVPVYDPMVVYGPWWWPAYRPYYYHPRGVVIRGVFGFGLGIRIGVAWGYAWGGFDWHRHNVIINAEQNIRINNHIDINRYVTRATVEGRDRGTWKHDPVHRQGVAYRTPAVAEKYGRGPRPGADTRRDYRGFEQPRGSAAPQARLEPPHGAPAPQAQQPRVTPSPVAKPEPPRVQTPPAQEPRVARPPAAKPEVARPAPAQPAQPAPAPPAVRTEPPRPLASTTRATQGTQGPMPFGGPGSKAEIRQFSNRGRESLGSTPPAGAPQPAGGSGGPHGGITTGGAPQSPPRGGGPGGGAPQGAPHGSATGGGARPAGGSGGPHGGH